jgi:hypothetical protein
VLLIVALLMPACASAPPPMRARAADPGSFAGLGLAPGQALIVEFKEGDVVPLALVVRGQFLEIAPDTPPIRVVAKRPFFLRLRGNEMEIGLDGEHFGDTRIAPGSFSFGVGADPQGVKASIVLTTPTHRL